MQASVAVDSFPSPGIVAGFAATISWWPVRAAKTLLVPPSEQHQARKPGRRDT